MKNGIRKDNFGMTLVELIVAIGIFVAAIVPMLYAFVYSTGFNFKSQRAMQSTGIAQAIAEKCKSVNFSIDDLENSFAIDGSTILDDVSSFTINGNASGDKEGIQAGPTGFGNLYWIYGVRATNNSTDGTTNRRAYDVGINWIAIHDSNTDYSSIQSMGQTTYNFGDSLSIALKNEDQVAQAKVINYINTLFDDSNITCSETLPTLPAGTLSAYFSSSDIDITKIVIDREIFITVSDPDTYYDVAVSPDHQSVQVKVNYYVGYDSDSNGIADSGNFRVTHDATIGGHTYTLVINKPLSSDFTWNTHSTPVYSVDFGSYYTFNKAASAVYFYYYPGYKSVDLNTASFRDHFNITNNMTVFGKDKNGDDVEKLDVYLFKQYDRDLDVASHPTYDDREENYYCDASVNSVDTLGNPGHKTYLYHNLLWKVVEDVSHSPHIFKLAKLTAPTVVFSCGSNCTNCTVSEPSYANYGSGYKKFNSTWTANNDDGLSLALSDYACLPYYHIDHPDSSVAVDNLFPTRLRVTILVYPAGDHTPGKELDIMTFEMLNW